jgi:type IX secretion system PorP/SprF family membrane protein
MPQMKKVYIIIILIVNTFCVFAQQTPQFTQYMYNTISVNPGYAGSREALSIVGLHRSQWVGVDGAPTTQTVSIHSPLRNEQIGVGFSFINDKLGYENFNYLYGDLSYTIHLTKRTKLAFGLKVGFSYYNINEELFTYPEVLSDPYFREKLNKWTPNIGGGLYLHQPKWYIGLSSPKLIQNDYNKLGKNVVLEQNHFYLIGGYVFDLNQDIKMRPTFLTKYTKGSPLSYDATLSFLFNEKIWLGASYRFGDSAGALVNFKLSKQLNIGYAYDYPISNLKPFTRGSHELMFIYDFKFDKTKYKSPRYF